MAIDDTPFSSLDPLGPSYGNINPPTLDEQGLAPFEGEGLSMPKPDFAKAAPHIVPIVPSAAELDNKHQSVKDFVGRKPGGTPTQKRMSAKDFGEAIGNYNTAVIQSNQDKNEYARIYSYDAGPSGNAFYKRYAAYGQETFDKIGFHPFRDNEAIFNAGTSGWADAKRMMVHGFWPLFKQGFVSGPKSLAKMMRGDFSADVDDARLYEEAAAIGTSTRGGVGSFLNNTAMSFGYTAGIIIEAALEEVAALGLEAATAGGATPALFAATANNARKLMNIGEAVRGIDKAVDATKAVNNTLKSLNNINNARKYWNTTKFEKALTSPVGRFFNPVENLSGAAFKIAKNEDNLTGLARLYDGTKKTVGALYGDVRAVNMALSEARLEGGMQQNELYDTLYNEFYSKNGYAPSDKEQRRMLAQAKEAGVTSLMFNSALIFASNKIVLDNLVNRRGGARSWLQSKTQDILDLKTGTVAREFEKTTLKSGKTFMRPKLSWRDQGLKDTFKSFAKDPIRKSLAGGISYFKRNITEALQENAQDVISEATKNYYLDSFTNPTKTTFDYAANLTKAAVKDQFSAKGLETFASGFVMGAFASPLNGVPKSLVIGYNKIFDKDNYEKYKQARETYGKNLVNELNSTDITGFWNNRMFTYGAQNSAATTMESADEKLTRDASDASFIHSMVTAAENDLMSHHIDYLESLKQLTPEELEEAVATIPEGEGERYLQTLDKAIDRAKSIEKRHNFYKEKFPNPVKLEDWEKNKDNPDYEDAVYTHHAWNTAIRNAVFLNESFENTAKRMSSILDDVVTNGPLKKANYSDVSILFDNKKLSSEQEMLQTEIESLKALPKSASTNADLKFKEDKLKSLSEYTNALDNYLKLSRNKEQLIDNLIKDNPEADPEEIIAEVNSAIQETYDELKDSYSNYIKVLADNVGESVFDEDIDSSFEKVVDFQDLDGESKGLVKYINLLHSPAEFIEHVKRNKVWMKQLYDNRKDYYEALKEQEISKKENNDLLNSLASRGIYISAEAFERWQRLKVFPDEFYDDVNKVVIRPSNYRYNELVEPFRLLAELQGKEPTVDEKNESFNAELQKLETEKQSRIDALEKSEVRQELGPIGKGRSVTMQQIVNELENLDYVDITYTVNDTPQQITLYKDGDIIKFDNIEGDVIDPADAKTIFGTSTFDSAVRYRISEQSDPEQVKQIEEEYERRKAELIKKNIEEGLDTPENTEAEEVKPVTTDTPLEALDAELYNQLYTAFMENSEDLGVEDLNEDDFMQAFESFVKTNYLAASIIDSWNNQRVLEKATKVSPTETVTPVMNIDGKEVSFDELSEADLKSYLRSYEIGLEQLEGKEERTEADENQIIYYRAYIKTISDYLNRRVQEGFSPEQRETVAKINKVLEAQSKIKRGKGGYEVDGVVMDRVTNVIRQFEEDYEYVDAPKVETTFRLTIGKDGLSPESIEAFVERLKVQNLKGFNDFTYNEITSKLTELTTQPERLEEIDLLTEIQSLVSESTFESGRVVGNYLDDQIRNIFDNKAPIFDEKLITQEAFENLFGKDGYVTGIKNIINKEGLYVISRGYKDNGVILYDKDAKIAGEMDLLAVDRAGNIFIVDVKTGKADKWRGFNREDNKYSKKNNYTLQQTAYANLLFNMIGETAKISLLPIQVEYNDLTSQITEGGRPVAKDFLEPGKYRIPLVITEDIQAKIDSIIPRKIEEAKPEEVRESSDEETSPAVVAQEEPVIEEEEGSQVDDSFREGIKNATQAQVNKINRVLAQKIAEGVYNAATVKELQELIDQRQRELSEEANIKLNEFNVEVGTQLISQASIFTDKNNTKQFATQGTEVRVISVDKENGKVVLKTIGNDPKQKTLSFEELNKLFILKQTVMDFGQQEKPETKLSKEEQDLVVDSSDSVKELLKDSTRKEALKKEAGELPIATLDAELFEDETSNC